MSKGQIQAKARQVDVLVAEILKYPDIARGEPTRNKEDVKLIWENIERVVNEAGPPEKTAFEWKKAWADKKKYIRKKLAQNLYQDKWDREKQWTFTKTEEDIIEMCSLVAPHTRNSSPRLTLKRRSRHISDDDDDDEADSSYGGGNMKEESMLFEDQIVEDYGDCQLPVAASTSKSAGRQEDMEFLEVEQQHPPPVVHQQQQPDGMRVVFTQLSKAIDRFTHQKKLMLEETRRHNMEMEKLRKLEIKNAMAKTEIKRKAYELELAQYKKENYA